MLGEGEGPGRRCDPVPDPTMNSATMMLASMETPFNHCTEAEEKSCTSLQHALVQSSNTSHPDDDSVQSLAPSPSPSLSTFVGLDGAINHHVSAVSQSIP